jgi:hypothetical protein
LWWNDVKLFLTEYEHMLLHCWGMSKCQIYLNEWFVDNIQIPKRKIMVTISFLNKLGYKPEAAVLFRYRTSLNCVRLS